MTFSAMSNRLPSNLVTEIKTARHRGRPSLPLEDRLKHRRNSKQIWQWKNLEYYRTYMKNRYWEKRKKQAQAEILAVETSIKNGFTVRSREAQLNGGAYRWLEWKKELEGLRLEHENLMKVVAKADAMIGKIKAEAQANLH